MGMLVEGKWTTEWYKPDADGRFVRGKTSFRDRVTQNGASPFTAEAGRYHLYVSFACPWAHRVLILRKLKKLEDVISLSVVDYLMGDDGWRFADVPGAIADSVNGAQFLRDIYVKAAPDYTGRVTVPVLWDKKTGTIVNNESRELIRILDSAFDEIGDATIHLFPADRRKEVDEIIDAIYEPINNGVYKCGFATTQNAYEEAYGELFAALDHWDAHLADRRYLLGDELTAADVCLFTTLVRFDPVYYGHFKCNGRHIYEYENLGPYLRDIYQIPGIAETVNMEHIKRHYYASHSSVNPTGIVPLGMPAVALTAPHDRDRFR